MKWIFYKCAIIITNLVLLTAELLLQLSLISLRLAVLFLIAKYTLFYFSLVAAPMWLYYLISSCAIVAASHALMGQQSLLGARVSSNKPWLPYIPGLSIALSILLDAGNIVISTYQNLANITNQNFTTRASKIATLIIKIIRIVAITAVLASSIYLLHLYCLAYLQAILPTVNPIAKLFIGYIAVLTICNFSYKATTAIRLPFKVMALFAATTIVYGLYHYSLIPTAPLILILGAIHSSPLMLMAVAFPALVSVMCLMTKITLSPFIKVTYNNKTEEKEEPGPITTEKQKQLKALSRDEQLQTTKEIGEPVIQARLGAEESPKGSSKPELQITIEDPVMHANRGKTEMPKIVEASAATPRKPYKTPEPQAPSIVDPAPSKNKEPQNESILPTAKKLKMPEESPKGSSKPELQITIEEPVMHANRGKTEMPKIVEASAATPRKPYKTPEPQAPSIVAPASSKNKELQKEPSLPIAGKLKIQKGSSRPKQQIEDIEKPVMHAIRGVAEMPQITEASFATPKISDKKAKQPTSKEVGPEEKQNKDPVAAPKTESDVLHKNDTQALCVHNKNHELQMDFNDPASACRFLGIICKLEDLTEGTINKAFRRFASEYHPDNNPTGAELFKKGNNAKKYLLDYKEAEKFEKLRKKETEKFEELSKKEDIIRNYFGKIVKTAMIKIIYIKRREKKRRYEESYQHLIYAQLTVISKKVRETKWFKDKFESKVPARSLLNLPPTASIPRNITVRIPRNISSLLNLSPTASIPESITVRRMPPMDLKLRLPLKSIDPNVLLEKGESRPDRKKSKPKLIGSSPLGTSF